MFPKTFSAAAAVLAASTLVSGQTFTTCNPLKKTCPADPAIGNKKVNCDMTGGLCSVFTELDGTELTFGDKGAVFSIEKESNAPTIRTGKYIFFGRVDFEIQASAGQGIVTSAVLQSDDLDEIDWEWVGGDTQQVQTNYFSKGDTTTYDRGKYHDVADPLTTFHTYSVEWTSASVIWLIDDAPVRTLTYAEAKGGSAFPQTPMEIKVGTWVAGRKDAPEGTVEWAGGYTDFSQAPFEGYYKSIAITDYAGKDSPTKDSIKEYIYGDNSGTWESIKVIKGDGSDDGGDDDTTTKKPTKTKTHSKPTSTKEPETTSTTEASTTEEPTKTKTKKTKTKTKTTATPTSSVTSAFTTTTSEAPSTTSGATESGTPTDGAPATTTSDDGDAAPRSVAALGGAFLAAAGVMFALL